MTSRPAPLASKAWAFFLMLVVGVIAGYSLDCLDAVALFLARQFDHQS